jgi:hypothetical protein
MAAPWYTTREDVTSALDVKLTARNYRQVDRAIESGARSVEGLLHRTFRPVLATRYFDWPNEAQRGTRPWRLWLNQHEVISVASLVAGGVTIPSSDYFLRNFDGEDQPPYTFIEIDLASSSAFASGDTHQRAIAATCLFGWRNDEEQVGDLTSNLDADVTDTATTTWTTPYIGVGDVLRIDSERMIVTDKTMVDSTQNTGGALTASAADVTVAVTDGTAFAVGMVLLIGSERMLVVDKAGNNLTVKRAWDGTVLAAHSSNADIYTLTGVELARAQLGTTLAAHTTGADVYRHLVPGLVRELNIAEAINTLQQEGTGYARRSGLGEERGSGKARNPIEASGRGLDDIREQAYAAFARKARVRAV